MNAPELKKFGFWYNRAQPHFPDPTEFVDPTFDPEERAKVVAYLSSGHARDVYLGYSCCSFCGFDRNGSADFTDGVWLFPQGLAHYVEHHDVVPPEAFLAHIRANDYRVPPRPLWLVEEMLWGRHLEPGTEAYEREKTRLLELD